MDVYPEIAAALGALSAQNFIYRAIRRVVHHATLRCASVVCLDMDMVKRVAVSGVKQGPVVAPWPPSELVIPDVTSHPASSRIRWIYSGNLGRAHEFEALLQAQRLLEDENRPFDLVFQGGGALRAEAEMRSAKLELKHCQWLGYADDDQLVSSLLQSHVCIATQRPEVAGLLWPSKLALLDLLPRPIVWIGPLDGAIAGLLRGRPGLNAIFAPDDTRGLAAWLVQNQDEILRQSESIFHGGMLRKQLHEARDNGVAAWDKLLTSLLA
jgi:hypothetical protein